MNTTGQKMYWDWLETFAAGRPFKADDGSSEVGRLQIHFEPPVLLDAPHGNATISGSWPASPTIFRRLGAARGDSTAIFGPGGGPTGRSASPPRFDFSSTGGRSWQRDVLPAGSSDTTTTSQMVGVWYGFPNGSHATENQTMTFATGNTSEGFNQQRATASQFGFKSFGADTFAVSREGILTTTRDPSVVWSWSGLPYPGINTTASSLFDSPEMYSIIQLPDNTFMGSVCITENGVPRKKGPDGFFAPMSLVAFVSKDGYNWHYSGTIMNHTAVPFSSFGPNENELSMLSDGKTVMAVIRPSGDGPCPHNLSHDSYRYYYQSYSNLDGRSWTTARPIEGAGCARPKLLLLEPAGPLILSGGRICMEKTSDMFIWCARCCHLLSP